MYQMLLSPGTKVLCHKNLNKGVWSISVGGCWAIGTLVSAAPEGARTPITYNPYRAATFTRRSDGAPVSACEFVHFTKEEGAVAVGGVA